MIKKYLKYILNIDSRARLHRDIIFLDNILSKNKLILILHRFGDDCSVYNFNTFDMSSVEIKMKDQLSQLICKRYRKTVSRVLKKNDEFFIEKYSKWKYAQIKNSKNRWSFDIRIENNRYVSVSLFYDEFNIYKEINSGYLFDEMNHNVKNRLFLNKKPKEEKNNDVDHFLFENKKKKSDLNEELFQFYQKIAYHKTHSIWFFLNKDFYKNN